MGSVPHWESKDYDLDGFPNPHLEFSREARSELDLEDPCCAEMNRALKKTKRRKRARVSVCVEARASGTWSLKKVGTYPATRDSAHIPPHGKQVSPREWTHRPASCTKDSVLERKFLSRGQALLG